MLLEKWMLNAEYNVHSKKMPVMLSSEGRSDGEADR
jgi:hypothetical protein